MTAPERMWAPTSEPFSTTTTPISGDSCLRRIAAASPAGPAPTITTSNSIASRAGSSSALASGAFIGVPDSSSASSYYCRARRQSLFQQSVGRAELIVDRGPVGLGHRGAAGVTVVHRVRAQHASLEHLLAGDAIEQRRHPRDDGAVFVRCRRLAPRLPPGEFGTGGVHDVDRD